MAATFPLARPGASGAPLPRPALDVRAYATGAALASMAVGTLVLAGWWLGASFVEVSRGRTGMLPSTAISLVLGGAALALAAMRAPGRGASGAATALAALLVAHSLAGLAVVLFDPGLDVIGARFSDTGLVPAANTSVAYLLLGAALLARDARVRIGAARSTELLAAGTAVIALVALFGHVYGAAALYESTRSFRTVGMTAAGALMLFVLSTGVFAIPSESGLVATLTSPRAAGRLARRLLSAIVLIPVLGLVIMLGQTAGLYTQPESEALLAVLAIVLGFAWITGTARSLDSSDVERARAEAEAARWKLFFEHAEWGAAMSGPDARLVLVNDAFARQHGYDAAEMIGMPAEALFPEDRQDDLRKLQAVFPGRKHARIRSEHVRRDGSRFPVLIDAAVIADEAGRLRHRAVHVQDLTERDRAEAHVARLAAIVESSDDAIFAATTDAVIVEWNRGAERLYGYRADEIIGQPGRILLPPERVSELQASTDRLLRRERVEPFETERLRKDGSRVAVSISASPIVDGEGRVIGFSTIARDITLRRAIEDALRKSEQRFRELFEGASDGIFVADLAGRYTAVNRAGCALLGFAREEILGKTIVDLIPPDEVPQLAHSKDRLLSGDVDVSEWHLRRKDGSYVPVEVSAKIHPDGRWQGFVRDIRERKAIEEELRRAHEAERGLRSELELVMHAGSAVTEELAAIPTTGLPRLLHTIALQAQMLTGADAVAVAIGTDPDRPFDAWATVGRDAELEQLVDRIPRARATMGRVARGGQVLRTEELADDPAFAELPPAERRFHAVLGVPIRHGGRSVGSVFLASTRRAQPFTDSNQRVIELLAARVGPAIEIARAYRAEALQRAWLSTVLEQMPEGVIILDRDGHFVLENPAARRLQRRTGGLDPWGNPTIYDLRDPSGAPIAHEDFPIVKAFSTGETVLGVEVALCKSDGEIVPVLASATPVRSDDAIAGGVVVFQDIRALKELERMREEWASVIAHDLRQPLNVISMATGVLLKRAEALGDPERKLLDRVLLATRSISRMVEDLLDASRIEAHRLTLTRAEHDFCAVVRDVLERNAPTVVDQELVVRCAGHAMVSIDPGRIEQVIVNLLSNAKKYGAPGTPIEVALGVHEDEVEVAITNHGPGIPPGDMDNLFQRFSRARDTATGKVVGIGLGLYICRGIVEAHGGSITAESTPGETTTFRFTIPRVRGASG